MTKGTVAFTSLGCDKNRVDSEVMLGILQEAGLTPIADEAQADVIVVNTCCFIQDALTESIETILELAEYKKTGSCKALLVAGCLGQRYQKELFDELPEVDAILGATAYEGIGELVDRLLSGEKKIRQVDDIDRKADDSVGKKRVLSTAGHFAYLKISEGCDNHCTYCIIPKLRGRHRSRSMESLLEEADALAKQGVRELILIGQDTSVYGRDLYQESRLGDLLRELCKIEGIEWVRLLYCYPETLTQDTIDAMAENPKVCRYIDMPIQHASDTVLRRMGRKSSQAILREKIGALRHAMPEIAIRTTLIAGFPGESEAEFDELMTFVEEMRFERLGVFAYSQEEGTPAASMPEQVPEEIKEERKDALLAAQKAIAAAWCEAQVGKEVQALVEGRLSEEENIYCARTQQDAPEIDGLLFVQSEEPLLTGHFVQVRIEAASDYDLSGRVVWDESGE